MDNFEFKLPIYYLKNKELTENNIIEDLYLLDKKNTSNNLLLNETHMLDVSNIDLSNSLATEPLYKYVFNPNIEFSNSTIYLWSIYYTSDVKYLKNTQKLIKNDKKFIINIEEQNKIYEIWDEIKNEKDFCKKYKFITTGVIQFLNNNSEFLQIMSIYNLSSPLLTLSLPILLLIIPFFILKFRKIQINLNTYLCLLKQVISKHAVGQLLNINDMDFSKKIYVLFTISLYFIQIYQNINSCLEFYKNINKIKYETKLIKTYLQNTIININILQNKCKKLKTYKKFMNNLNIKKNEILVIIDNLKNFNNEKFNISDIINIGDIMKTYYNIYNNKTLHKTLLYTFGLNGYFDNLNELNNNISKNNISKCKFSKKYTNFKNAYFPNLINNNPIKNTYNLNEQMLITGPNAAGKTTLLKTTLFNILISQQIGYGFYDKANIYPYQILHSYINLPDTSGRDSLFQLEAKRCKNILDIINNNKKKNYRHFCIFDELYSGTNPYEAIASATSLLNYLNKNKNVYFMLTTHFIGLCENLNNTQRFRNYHMKINKNKNDFEYTYKINKGISKIKGGLKVLIDLKYPKDILYNTYNIINNLII